MTPTRRSLGAILAPFIPSTHGQLTLRSVCLAHRQPMEVHAMNKFVSRRATILGMAASILVLPVAAQYGGGIVGTGGGAVVATLKRLK